MALREEEAVVSLPGIMSHSARGLRKIALVGNPNSGKSTVFNQLTGLRQKTGNFPGVTVISKWGGSALPMAKKQG